MSAGGRGSGPISSVAGVAMTRRVRVPWQHLGARGSTTATRGASGADRHADLLPGRPVWLWIVPASITSSPWPAIIATR